VVPELIPIGREVGNRTEYIGTYTGGQFMAYVVSVNRMVPEDGLLAVLHLFGRDGSYRDTEFETFTIEIDEVRHWEQAEGVVLDAMIARLGDAEFGPIAVRLFEFEAHGKRFGLVERSANKQGRRVWFLPLLITFHEPWNGRFDT
jgi:hypothetical protein